jgi:formylglycine-generating enzyme required for sulfatase activity
MASLDRRTFLKTLVGISTSFLTVPQLLLLHGDPTSAASWDFESPLIHPPTTAEPLATFRHELVGWRRSRKSALEYDDRRYRNPAYQWVSSNFACCFLMLWDEQLYDPKAGVYTIESFLRHARDYFGGFDSIVLWHAYPRLGADDRNQFDFYRDMPGGLIGLRSLVRECRSASVRTFIAYNPWDTATRREPLSDIDSLAALSVALGADGVFLDTMPYAPDGLRDKLDATGEGLVMEGEDSLPLNRIHDHHHSWAQQYRDGMVPGILRNKWFERRHIQHQVDRWNLDRTAQIHTAWMNGSGILVWENVFGSWVGWNARDRSLLRMMLPIQRRYSALFAGEGWTPLIPTEQPSLYASQWEDEIHRLWTLVNRSDDIVQGDLFRTDHHPSATYFDLIRGTRVDPMLKGPSVLLSGSVMPRGVGAFLSVEHPSLVGSDFHNFLESQGAIYARYDSSQSVPALHTIPMVASASATFKTTPPRGMVAIPPATVRLRIEFQTRECGFYDSSGDLNHIRQNLFKPYAFERFVALRPYAIDLTPITNAEFFKFLEETSYRPRHTENFLKHWHNGRPPVDKADHPVVYVDLEDARAYARWAGKRLPTEEQWQYAAQGPNAFKYPWGNTMQSGRCNDGRTGNTTSVYAFPDGRSPFGCFDMCGNTWEWTESERTDGRTRHCVIRGGCYYVAQGSHWYMDGGPRPNDFAAKFILMWPGLDRCATIGFRCIVDLA